MSEYCDKCKEKRVFYDGSFEHNPKFVCGCEESQEDEEKE